MIRFNYIANSPEHRLLQRLRSYSAMESIHFDDCHIEINTDDNKIKGSVQSRSFRMYRINDTEYCYYSGMFSKTIFKARVFTDKKGIVRLKGITLPHRKQLIALFTPIILALAAIVIGDFFEKLGLVLLFLSLLSCGLSMTALVHTILHAAFSVSRLKRFLKSLEEDQNDQI